MPTFRISEAMAKGVAHLYIGLTKADGTVTDDERDERILKKIVDFWSKNIYYLDGRENEAIYSVLIERIGNEREQNMDADEHKEIGLDLISNYANQLDDVEPIRETMREIAKLDEFTVQESRFIRSVIESLNDIRGR
jgi:hypothetical protein